MKEFRQLIVNWYVNIKRDLPWRSTKEAYKIWISEIILQQTRVKQGIPYYMNFLDKFPTIKDLAMANEDEVLKIWQGLGYYSRARNLHFTAKYIYYNLEDKFPSEYNELLQLKGIGKYTAAAIMSFAYQKPYPIVDGNVFRVLSRIFGISTPIDTNEGKKIFYELAYKVMDKKKPDIYNQAIMEFGALQCVPKNPKCKKCFYQDQCYAFTNHKTEQFPIKSKKIIQNNRYFNYLVLNDTGYLYIQKRKDKDIWNGLYEFPLIEMSENLSETELIQSEKWKSFFDKCKYVIISISKIQKHVLSHQIIYARFLEIELQNTTSLKIEKNLKIKRRYLNEYAIPRLIENYIDTKTIIEDKHQNLSSIH